MAEHRLRMLAMTDLPDLGIKEGDLITFVPGERTHPFLISRNVPLDYGAVLVAMNEGKLEPMVLTHGGASSVSPPPLPSDASAPQSGCPLPRRLRLHRSVG